MAQRSGGSERRDGPPGDGPVPPDVLDALAAAVAAVLPALAARVPRDPAAGLGRLGLVGLSAGLPDPRMGVPGVARPVGAAWPRGSVPPSVSPRPGPAPGAAVSGAPVARPPAARSSGRRGTRPAPAAPPGPPGGPRPMLVPPYPAGPAESPTLATLRRLGPARVERLHGALELAVEELRTADWLGGVPAALARAVPAAPDGTRSALLRASGDAEPENAVILLDQFRWGTTALVTDLVRALRVHPGVAPLLAVAAPGGAAGADPALAETGVAARHGAVHLALGVATSAAVLHRLPLPAAISWTPAVIGTGLGSAALVLAGEPMPEAYAEAATARRRAEYALPRQAHGQVCAAGHRIALAEGALADLDGLEQVGFAANGLVREVPGGVVIRTGTAGATVSVGLTILDGPPPDVDVANWDEVVELSFTAAAGAASVLGRAGDDFGRRGGGLLEQTPPWPGEFRVRVHAWGRDDAPDQDGAFTGPGILMGSESYELAVWEAPRGPEVVYSRADRLGYRLRGEPMPAGADRPEQGYRWVRRSSIGEAATVTVVAGTVDTAAVVRAFGGDPERPRSLRELREAFDPEACWVAVLAVDGAVVAVEDNGFQGSRREVLGPLSRLGRVASMYWNVNALTRASIAERGEVLASFEVASWEAGQVGAAGPYVHGLDLDSYRDRVGKGLVVVERFTGHRFGPGDLAGIESGDTAFLVVNRR